MNLAYRRLLYNRASVTFTSINSNGILINFYGLVGFNFNLIFENSLTAIA